MSFQPLTPENCALILVDLQAGPVATVGSLDPQRLRANALSLARVARLLGLPTVVSAADIPAPDGALLPGLAEALPPHALVRHTRNNAWEAPEFVAAVAATGRRALVMAGVATDVGLGLTALSAACAGYTVYVLVDVCGTLDARAEQVAWLRLAHAGVTLTSWVAFVGEVQGDYTTERGRQLRALVGQAVPHAGGVFTETEP